MMTTTLLRMSVLLLITFLISYYTLIPWGVQNQWNGMVVWNAETEHWSGTLEWNTGMEYWNKRSITQYRIVKNFGGKKVWRIWQMLFNSPKFLSPIVSN